jgi:hypothetical protein
VCIPRPSLIQRVGERAVLIKLDLGLDLPAINRTTFPLPTLGDVLDDFCATVHEGQGFALLRGLNPSAFSKRDQVVLYLGISSYIAERRGRQNQDGMMLSEISTSSSLGTLLIALH